MCGRYSLSKPLKSIAEHFSIRLSLPHFQERYNIAPSQMAPVILPIQGRRELQEMRWGLIPAWAKDIETGYRMINARAETIAEKPSFKRSFETKRCLVAADGFFEWQPSGNDKIPHYIFLKSRELFVFAGIWSEWKHKEELIRSFSIITTSANSKLRSIHERMPVILPPKYYDTWLAPDSNPQTLHRLLSPYPSEEMECHIISKMINSPKNDCPECLTPKN